MNFSRLLNYQIAAQMGVSSNNWKKKQNDTVRVPIESSRAGKVLLWRKIEEWDPKIFHLKKGSLFVLFINKYFVINDHFYRLINWLLLILNAYHMIKINGNCRKNTKSLGNAQTTTTTPNFLQLIRIQLWNFNFDITKKVPFEPPFHFL